MGGWNPQIGGHASVPRGIRAMADVGPLLDRLVNALGAAFVARLLGTDGPTIRRWLRLKRPIDPMSKPGRAKGAIDAAMIRRIVDVHDLFTRAMLVFPSDAALDWLLSSEPRLEGARPIDVLGAEGIVPVIRALDSISARGY
jgi:hypothetical protein